MKAFWRFVRQMIREHRLGLAIAMLFAFLSAGGLGAGLFMLGPMFQIVLSPDDARSLADLAVEHNADSATWIHIPQWVIEQLPETPYAGVMLICVVLAIMTIVGGAANFLHQYLSQTITTRVIADIRAGAYRLVLQMPLSRVVQRGPSEFVARLVRDAAELQRGLIALVSKSVTQVTKGVAALIVAICLDWRLALIALVVAPILAVALRKIGKRIRRGTRGSLEAQEGLLRVATESLQGLRAVKTGTAEEHFAGRFEAINTEVVRHELRIRTARALSAPLVETLAVFAIVGLALIAVGPILSGTLELGTFVLTLGALAVSGGSFRPLAGLINEMQAAAAPADRLADVFGEALEADADDARPVLPRHGGALVFEGVGYTYPDASDAALTEVSLKIVHGERVAIVGPNGSGKTTLASMVPLLLRPDRGRVTIDDTDITTVNLASLRSQIGVVTQETVLTRGSVADNIAFGLEGVDREQIIAAAKQARADEFITRLPGVPGEPGVPGGYDADLAEQGASLSGGQRQRLAIARVILRDPSIIILDEATSQVDAESEARINEALAEFCVGRTALIIAHRLATVLEADRIVVMDAGRIVDHGTHDELLSQCELYRRLTETQLVTVS